jgi:hypothetical protein
MAAEGEEVVVRARGGEAQQLRPDPGEDLLRRRSRCAGRGRGRRLGLGERAAVHLAVAGDRQPLQRHEGGRHHVVRQPPRQVLPQRPGSGRCIVGGNHVRDQTRVSAGLGDTRDDDGLADVGMIEEDRFDLAQLDAEAADLHLRVGPADVLQRTVGAAPREVAAAVAARAGMAGIGVGDEALGREHRPPQVAAGDAAAAHVHLAGDARRDGSSGRIQHLHREVRDGDADGAGAAGAHVIYRDLAPGDVHRRLGDAVHVDQPRPCVAVPVHPPAQRRGVQRLAAEDHAAKGEITRRSARGGVLLRARELAEGRGRLV